MSRGFWRGMGSLPLRTLQVMICLEFALLAGCGPGEAEIRATGSMDDAQMVIVTALDAWKDGITPGDLAKQDLRIIMGDEDWQDGRRLTAYGFPVPGIENGGHWRICTKLTFDQGSPVTVYYAVTPGNPASVIRSDFSE